MTGREIRLARLFSENKNAVIVAADHGEFDGPIPGMIDLPAVLKNIHPGVDGVLLAPGMITRAGHVFSRKGSPMAVARLNWSTVYAFHWGYREAATVPAFSAGDALERGADVVLISLTLQTGSEERDARNVETFCRLREEAHRLGFPVIGEYFPAEHGKLSPDELHEKVYTCCRILAELGADLIKTFHTNRFSRVVESCPVPILGLGAEKTPRQIDALRLAEREVKDGARGVVFGRNALQVADPIRFQKALCEVVKEGVSAEEAVKKHGLTE